MRRSDRTKAIIPPGRSFQDRRCLPGPSQDRAIRRLRETSGGDEASPGGGETETGGVAFCCSSSVLSQKPSRLPLVFNLLFCGHASRRRTRKTKGYTALSAAFLALARVFLTVECPAFCSFRCCFALFSKLIHFFFREMFDSNEGVFRGSH